MDHFGMANTLCHTTSSIRPTCFVSKEKTSILLPQAQFVCVCVPIMHIAPLDFTNPAN